MPSKCYKKQTGAHVLNQVQYVSPCMGTHLMHDHWLFALMIEQVLLVPMVQGTPHILHITYIWIVFKKCIISIVFL